MSIGKNDLQNLKSDLIHVIEKQQRESIEAIKTETHDAIKTTGHTWIEAAVRKITPVAVESTLLRLGMDPKQPIELQKDFAWLRNMREQAENSKKVVIKSAFSYLTTAGIAAIIAWFMTQYK